MSEDDRYSRRGFRPERKQHRCGACGIVMSTHYDWKHHRCDPISPMIAAIDRFIAGVNLAVEQVIPAFEQFSKAIIDLYDGTVVTKLSPWFNDSVGATDATDEARSRDGEDKS